jgi:hypothetical protein
MPTTNRRWAKQILKAAEARANEHDTTTLPHPQFFSTWEQESDRLTFGDSTASMPAIQRETTLGE